MLLLLSSLFFFRIPFTFLTDSRNIGLTKLPYLVLPPVSIFLLFIYPSHHRLSGFYKRTPSGLLEYDIQMYRYFLKNNKLF